MKAEKDARRAFVSEVSVLCLSHSMCLKGWVWTRMVVLYSTLTLNSTPQHCAYSQPSPRDPKFNPNAQCFQFCREFILSFYVLLEILIVYLYLSVKLVNSRMLFHEESSYRTSTGCVNRKVMHISAGEQLVGVLS